MGSAEYSEEMFAWADRGRGVELVSSSYSAFPSGSTEYETGMSSGRGRMLMMGESIGEGSGELRSSSSCFGELR